MKGGERFMLDVVKNVVKATVAIVVGYCVAIMMIVAVCAKLGLLEEWFCAHIKWAALRAALFQAVGFWSGLSDSSLLVLPTSGGAMRLRSKLMLNLTLYGSTCMSILVRNASAIATPARLFPTVAIIAFWLFFILRSLPSVIKLLVRYIYYIILGWKSQVCRINSVPLQHLRRSHKP